MNILISLIAGIALGIFFYAGLWLTVRRLPESRHPVLLTLMSYWGRTVGVLMAFLLVMNGRWENGLAALVGFGVARVFVSAVVPKRGQPRCI